MRLFVTCVLIFGFAVCVFIGLLRVARDLLARSVWDAPSLPNDDYPAEFADDNSRAMLRRDASRHAG
jgi:hypothetical protein